MFILANYTDRADNEDLCQDLKPEGTGKGRKD